MAAEIVAPMRRVHELGLGPEQVLLGLADGLVLAFGVVAVVAAGAARAAVLVEAGRAFAAALVAVAHRSLKGRELIGDLVGGGDLGADLRVGLLHFHAV